VHLTTLLPSRFRNLASAPIDFSPGINILLGDNGAGKTNVLEAIAVCAGQRSFRGARYREMALDTDTGFGLEAVLDRGGAAGRLSAGWNPARGAWFAREGKPMRFTDAGTSFPVVFLAPEHRRLIEGSPADRRRFLDRLVVALWPAAADELLRCDRALRQRNALLSGGGADGEEFESWSEEFCLAAAAVIARRRAAIEAIGAELAPLLSEGGPGLAGVRIEYLAREQARLETLARLRMLERRRGHTLAGPHRDDLRLTRGGRPLAEFASSGEIKRIVALLKLAEWHAVARASGRAPLFGFDDFDADLSPASGAALLCQLPGDAQIVLTTAREEAVAFLRKPPDRLFQVAGGCVLEKGLRRLAVVR
jgi:DNA replication and repair protein RecF